jgi:hypothetical protein
MNLYDDYARLMSRTDARILQPFIFSRLDGNRLADVETNKSYVERIELKP